MLLVIICLSCAALGYGIGKNKGRGTEGAVLGLLLGLIGVIIVACLKPKPGFRRAIPAAPDNYLPAPPAYLPTGQWAPDPHRRHEMRWWNGVAWTNQVSDAGVHTLDPFGAVPSPPSAGGMSDWTEPYTPR
jgi:hypothetical protein